MKNLLLLLNYLIKFYDLLLNLFLHNKQAQLPLPNLLRTLGLTIEEVGDIVEDVAAVDGEVLTVTNVEDVDITVVMVIMDGEVLMGMGIITVLTAKKDLPEVHMEVLEVHMEDLGVHMEVLGVHTEDLEATVVLTVVVEEESGDITLRNLKNKRCE
jgi:hypothetical protein